MDYELTSLTFFLVVWLKMFMESRARKEPSAVTMRTFRTGIEAAQKRSKNPISKTIKLVSRN